MRANTMIKSAIADVVAGRDLSEEQARAVMTAIMEEDVTPAQLAALVTALRIKGETVDEVAGFASVMRDKAVPVQADGVGVVIDTCGTGGDGRGTFNVSTAAAIVAAAVGPAVAKHGNRAASSRCGSADVLDALGVAITLGPREVASCLERAGIAFVLCGADGIDEISICGPTYVAELRHGTVRRYEVTPEELGVKRAAFEEI